MGANIIGGRQRARDLSPRGLIVDGFAAAHSPPAPRTIRRHGENRILPLQRTIRSGALLDQANRAEAAGFDALWVSDHFHPWNDEQGESPFVWGVIGALSQVTTLPVTSAAGKAVR